MLLSGAESKASLHCSPIFQIYNGSWVSFSTTMQQNDWKPVSDRSHLSCGHLSDRTMTPCCHASSFPAILFFSVLFNCLQVFSIICSFSWNLLLVHFLSSIFDISVVLICLCNPLCRFTGMHVPRICSLPSSFSCLVDHVKLFIFLCILPFVCQHVSLSLEVSSCQVCRVFISRLMPLHFSEIIVIPGHPYLFLLSFLFPPLICIQGSSLLPTLFMWGKVDWFFLWPQIQSFL